MTQQAGDVPVRGAAPTGRPRRADTRPSTKPSGAPDGSTVPRTDRSSDAENRRFDKFDGALAPSTPGRRGPLAVRARIIWVHGPAADALSRMQGRVLRDLLAALIARRQQTAGQTGKEAPHQ